MTELKTLKDIEGTIGSAEYFHHKDREPTKDYEEVVIVEELRQEAIKWIEVLEQNYSQISSQAIYGQIVWIKEFFNITEEDLK